jgi:hypothetical protein
MAAIIDSEVTVIKGFHEAEGHCLGVDPHFSAHILWNKIPRRRTVRARTKCGYSTRL